MPSRREFIQTTSLTFSAFSVAGALSFHRAAAAPEALPDVFICDNRYAESVREADVLSAHDIPVHHFNGDLTELWVRHLAKRWKQGPMTLSGVTGKDALFVLEVLAWDHAMQVSHRKVLTRESLQADGGNVPLVSWTITPRTMHT